MGIHDAIGQVRSLILNPLQFIISRMKKKNMTGGYTTCLYMFQTPIPISY